MIGVGGGERRAEFEQSFVAHHLQSIDLFETRLQTIESDHSEGNDWYDLPTGVRSRYSILTTSGIIRCMAFLEATANDMIRRLTRSDGEPASGYHIHPRLRSEISSEEAQTLIDDRIPTLGKFDAILERSGHNVIQRRSGVGQRACCVRDLRNHVIHYEPEMLPSDELPAGAELLPRELRWSNPFENERMPPFERCMGSKLIEWAADSSFEYAEEFFDELDIENDVSPDASPLDQLACDENPARPYATILDSLDHDYK